MRDAPLRYNIMEKQDFSLIKELKDFRVYILHSHIVAITHLDPEGRRVKWIPILLECDLEIKHTKLVKGQGLDKLMTQSSIDFLEINLSDTSIGTKIKNNE